MINSSIRRKRKGNRQNKKFLEKLEMTLKIEVDKKVFKKVYDHISPPIEIKDKNQNLKIAVKVISQFGKRVCKM